MNCGIELCTSLLCASVVTNSFSIHHKPIGQLRDLPHHIPAEPPAPERHAPILIEPGRPKIKRRPRPIKNPAEGQLCPGEVIPLGGDHQPSPAAFPCDVARHQGFHIRAAVSGREMSVVQRGFPCNDVIRRKTVRHRISPPHRIPRYTRFPRDNQISC